jgi:hypothetical protein
MWHQHTSVPNLVARTGIAAFFRRDKAPSASRPRRSAPRCASRPATVSRRRVGRSYSRNTIGGWFHQTPQRAQRPRQRSRFHLGHRPNQKPQHLCRRLETQLEHMSASLSTRRSCYAAAKRRGGPMHISGCNCNKAAHYSITSSAAMSR